MDGLTFWKMTGGGNDFLVFHDPDGTVLDSVLPHLPHLCTRALSVGSDGALFVGPSDHADIRVRYRNADKSPAEFCGNGTCCASKFAYLENLAGARQRVETEGGVLEAYVQDTRVTLDFPPELLGKPIPVTISVPGNDSQRAYRLHAGSPHLVVFVKDIDRYPVAEAGSLIQSQSEFAPRGVNVNFVEATDAENFLIRTYERGIEREVLACGTGCVSAALSAVEETGSRFPARFVSRSGIGFTIDVREEVYNEERQAAVSFTGDARVVFRGKLTPDAVAGFESRLDTP